MEIVELAVCLSSLRAMACQLGLLDPNSPYPSSLRASGPKLSGASIVLESDSPCGLLSG